MVELGDTPVLGAGALQRGGSKPSFGTNAQVVELGDTLDLKFSVH